MTNDQREIQRKLRVLRHAETIGSVAKTCRYFGIGRASFYRWKTAYRERGVAGLVNARSVPHRHPNKTPPEVAEKVLHLRRKYHLGPIRIVWYLDRYHGIKISDAGVYRILKRNGLNRLPRGTGSFRPVGFGQHGQLRGTSCIYRECVLYTTHDAFWWICARSKRATSGRGPAVFCPAGRGAGRHRTGIPFKSRKE